MIFERRRYTVQPGCIEAFMQAQHDRGFDGAVRAILDRLIGYFLGVTGPTDQVVHLYRYDDLEDWRRRLYGLYVVPELQPYFVTARAILAAQETDFFQAAPIPALVPLWSDGVDWLPGPGSRRFDLAATPDLVVEEETVQLRPGGLVRYWEAMTDSGLEAAAPLMERHLATWHAMTGRLHAVVSYRAFATPAEREARRGAAAEGAAMSAFEEAIREVALGRETRLMRPVRVAEMSPLFEVS